MSPKNTCLVQPRSLFGKKSKQLRSKNLLPANVYGLNEDSIAIQLKEKDFVNLYQEAGDTGVVYLKIEGEDKEKPVLIDELQTDPVLGNIVHVSFKQVDLKEKIKAEIPVELIGDFELKEAVLVTVKDAVEVEALPTDLPEKFEIDVSLFTEVGQSFTLGDLKFDRSKVELVGVEEEQLAEPLVLVQEQREEEPEEVEGVEPEEGAVAAEAEEASEGTQEGEEDSENKGEESKEA